MNGYLLDTNVPSELTRNQPSPHVEQWLESADDDRLFLSVISIAEILHGVHRLPEDGYRRKLQGWLDATLRPWFAGRILPVNQQIAERMGQLAGERDRAGMTIATADGLIVATAMEHDLTLVTRNTRHFTGLGVDLLKPWQPHDPLILPVTRNANGNLPDALARLLTLT